MTAAQATKTNGRRRQGRPARGRPTGGSAAPGQTQASGAGAAAARAGRAALSRAGGHWLRFRRRRERDALLERLRSDEYPMIAAVGRALTAAVAEPGPDERAWIDRIEELRSELARSGRVIEAPRSEWTGDPSDEERVRVTPVAKLALEASKPARWGRVLLNLARELRPERTLELGTCVGLSTAYQIAGLELGGVAGSAITLEAASARVEIASANFDRLALAGRVDARAGRFDETLAPALDDARGLGFAFVDGHHKRGPTLRYFKQIAWRMGGGGVILFDDIRWSGGMARAWERISVDPRVALAADLHGLGLCVIPEPDADGVPHRLEMVLHP